MPTLTTSPGSLTSIAAALLLLSCGASAAADLTSPVGRWRTVDDKTGKPRSIVLIWEDKGALFGKVESSLNPATAGRKCDKCTDERKDQPIVGMTLIRNMKKSGGEYAGGDILDPDNGSVYRCKLKLTDGGQKLSVRGYIGISLIGRSQTWTREP
jgi:uncharacterized protein (DUF2147 family)